MECLSSPQITRMTLDLINFIISIDDARWMMIILEHHGGDVLIVVSFRLIYSVMAIGLNN